MEGEGYTSRPARLADAGAVARVIARREIADFGASDVEAADVVDDWAGIDFEGETRVVERAGEVVATADLVVREGAVGVYLAVAPEATGLGLATHLLDWAEGRARAVAVAGPVVVRHHVADTNTPATRLLERRGYVFQRAVLRMERDLDTPSGDADAAAGGSLPDGVLLRTYRGEDDEPAAHAAHEAGSLDMNGRSPNTFEQWLTWVGTKDPELIFLAEAEGGAIVGDLIASVRVPDTDAPGSGASGAAMLGAAWPDAGGPAAVGSGQADGPRRMGHVDSLRVVREWRRRGVGSALLAHAFAALRARGATAVALTVDAASPTGAPGLYLAAGMRVARRYLVMERTVTAG